MNEEAKEYCLDSSLIEEANEIAKIGWWCFEPENKKLLWSKVTKKIHEVPESFTPTVEDAINFYKEGESREKITQAVNEAINYGKEIELDLELVTYTGKHIWVRSIIHSDFKDGKCIKISGTFQDITKDKNLLEILSISNERFKGIFDNSNFGVAILSLEGNYIDVNQKLCDLLGYTKEEMLQKTFYEITENIDNDLKLENKHKLLTQEVQNIRMEKNYIHKNGNTLLVLVNITTIKNFNKIPYQFIVIVEDLTAIIKAENKMLENENRWKLAVEGIADGVCILNLQTNHLEFSPQLKKLLGYEPLEFPNTFEDWQSITHTDSLKSTNEKLNDYFSGKTDSYTNEVQFFCKDGSYKWILFKGRIITFSEDGKPLRFITINSDISLQKQREEDLKNSITMLGEQNQKLLNFAYIVSHNLRSHSSNLEMLINLLDFTEDKDEKLELLDHFKSVSKQLNETINNLNEIVSIQNKVNSEKELIKLKRSIDNTIEKMKDEISRFNINIEVDVPEYLEVMFNPNYMDNILISFLSNSIRYRILERKTNISFKSYFKNDHVILEIKDNGKGINLKRYGGKIFGMYKTFHGNSSAKGMGLFIAKNQVEAMGGKIEVESEVNIGTTFKVRLT